MHKSLQRVLVASALLFTFVAGLSAGQRHWVGSGSGNGRFWDRAANWSLTQGGAGGAGVPTAADDAFNDGGGALQVNTNAVCLSFTQSSALGTKDFINNATLTVGAGGLALLGGQLGSTTSGNVVTVAGNWTENGGTFSPGTMLVVLNGTTAQTVTTSSSFGALTVNSSGGVTLASNLTVTGALTLTSGVVSTGASSLILASTGTLTRTGGWVSGNFQMPVGTGATSVTFHVGDASNYSPVVVAFGNVTTAGSLTGKATAGDHPNLGTSAIDGSKSVNRYYTLANSGVVFTNYNATFNFVAGDLDGGANTANFIVGKYNSPNWTLPTVGTKTATSTQVTGLTTFSDFAIGDISTPTINASAGPNGSITPSGAVSVTYGQSQSFTISPNANYYVSDVVVDGVSQGGVTSYNFPSVTANHTIAASFLADTVTVNALAGVNGSISPSDAVRLASHSNQSFTITPDAHFHVLDVLVDGVSVGAVTNYSFTDLIVDHTIVVSFQIDTDTITASAGANGSISPSGTVVVDYGSDNTFTLTPSAGYHVADVLVDGVSVGAVPEYTFTGVAANHTISASFAITTYNVVAGANAHGSISPSGTVPVDSGANQSFTITPDLGYFISDVHVDSVSVGPVPGYTFTNVTANHTIEVSFAIQTFAVKGIADANGSISPSGLVLVDYGADQTFTFTPDAGYLVSDVHVDSVSVGPVSNYTFTSVTAPHVIEVSFVSQTFTVNASAGANGSISPSGAVSVNYGASQSFTITPDAGYLVADVHVDSVSVGAVPNYTFTNVTANHTIEASFALQAFTVFASAGPHGTIAPSGAVPASSGGTLVFNITPDSAYFVADVHVDSVSVGALSKYTFTNILGDHTIEAFFDTHPLPQLKTVSPLAAFRGQTLDLVLTGLNFVNGVSTLNGGAGITVNSFTVHTSDTILANVSVGAGSALGSTSFSVTNSAPGGGTSGPVGFTVLNHAPAAFGLTGPLNSDTIKLKSPGVPIEFSWHPSTDLDAGDTLKYFVIVQSPSPILVGVTTDSSFSSSDLMSLLVPQTAYTWNVLVTDGSDSVLSTETFTFTTSDSVTAVTEKGKLVPKEYALHQNYPNPFNPSTTVEFDLPHQSVVTLAVYNLLGQRVATLIDHRSMDIGYLSVKWDASSVPSGVYLYRMSADGADGKSFVRVKKMMLMR